MAKIAYTEMKVDEMETLWHEIYVEYDSAIKSREWKRAAKLASQLKAIHAEFMRRLSLLTKDT